MQVKNRVSAIFKAVSVFAVALAVGGLVCFGSPARAGDPPNAGNTTDAAGIQAVILKQIDAFQHDDAHTAFAIAAPEIQKRFGSSTMFMDMVRRGYAPVYNPRYVEFGVLVSYDDAAENTGRFVQHVVVEGADGTVMMAVYAMQKDDAGKWRIAGCNLTPLRRESL